jgi:DNA-binding transcriptional LysR family regulator
VLFFNLKAFHNCWLFRDAAGRVESVPIDGDITLAPAGSLLAAAIDGLGPALLPDWLVENAIGRGELVDVLPEHRAAATTFDTAAWLVYPSRAFLPRKVRAMVDFLRVRLAKGLRAPSIRPADLALDLPSNDTPVRNGPARG